MIGNRKIPIADRPTGRPGRFGCRFANSARNHRTGPATTGCHLATDLVTVRVGRHPGCRRTAGFRFGRRHRLVAVAVVPAGRRHRLRIAAVVPVAVVAGYRHRTTDCLVVVPGFGFGTVATAVIPGRRIVVPAVGAVARNRPKTGWVGFVRHPLIESRIRCDRFGQLVGRLDPVAWCRCRRSVRTATPAAVAQLPGFGRTAIAATGRPAGRRCFVVADLEPAGLGIADPGIVGLVIADPEIVGLEIADPGIADPGIAVLGIVGLGIAVLAIVGPGIVVLAIVGLGTADLVIPGLVIPGLVIVDLGTVDPRIAGLATVDLGTADLVIPGLVIVDPGSAGPAIVVVVLRGDAGLPRRCRLHGHHPPEVPSRLVAHQPTRHRTGRLLHWKNRRKADPSGPLWTGPDCRKSIHLATTHPRIDHLDCRTGLESRLTRHRCLRIRRIADHRILRCPGRPVARRSLLADRNHRIATTGHRRLTGRCCRPVNPRNFPVRCRLVARRRLAGPRIDLRYFVTGHCRRIRPRFLRLRILRPTAGRRIAPADRRFVPVVVVETAGFRLRSAGFRRLL